MTPKRSAEAQTATAGLSIALDILSRPGGNDRVVEKKVLLATLAGQEAERLGILPNADQVQAVADAFRQNLGLPDAESMRAWLTQESLTTDDLDRVITDFATVLTVESYYKQRLATTVEQHRRVMAARSQWLARQNPPR